MSRNTERECGGIVPEPILIIQRVRRLRCLSSLRCLKFPRLLRRLRDLNRMRRLNNLSRLSRHDQVTSTFCQWTQAASFSPIETLHESSAPESHARSRQLARALSEHPSGHCERQEK